MCVSVCLFVGGVTEKLFYHCVLTKLRGALIKLRTPVAGNSVKELLGILGCDYGGELRIEIGSLVWSLGSAARNIPNLYSSLV